MAQIEVESALGIPSQIEAVAEQKGWKGKWSNLGSITNRLDRVFFDTFLFERNGRKEIVVVVYIDKENDLVISSYEELLEGIGMSGSGEE